MVTQQRFNKLNKEYLDSLIDKLQLVYSDYACKFNAGVDATVVNGLIFPQDYPRYRESVGSAQNKFERSAMPILSEIEDIASEARILQPKLEYLAVEDANTSEIFPGAVVLGDIELKYKEDSITVPNVCTLPLEKPLYQLESESTEGLQKLLLRLLFTCPMGKVQVLAFDKENYGDALDEFKALLSVPEIFPKQKILTDGEEFKEELSKLNNEVNMLLQHEFPKYRGCKNWCDYNELMIEMGKANKCLPYRIVCYFGIHTDEMNNECFTMFKRLANWGPRVGILPVFSFAKSDIVADHNGNYDRNTVKLMDLCDISIPISELTNVMPNQLKESKLPIMDEVMDKLPRSGIYDLLLDYKFALEGNRKPVISFNELLNPDALNSRSSMNGIFIPMGSNAQNGEVVELAFGDPAKHASPHALVGGITGSGKSNLLHVIISSASWYYGPDELNIYLLDFKDGVEFNTYAHNKLPQAKLVAVESDAEYGVTVLEHLDQEQNRRNNIFKKYKVKDFYNYRKLLAKQYQDGVDFNEEELMEVMPRILVIVDEFQRLLLDQNAFAKLLKLAQQGRSAGIHMLLCAQSLQGLDFGQAEKQFQARIALKCLAEDSARLLGSYNNTEAVNLEVPYAILNTAGVEDFNIKFAVPEAKPEEVEVNVQKLANDWLDYGRDIDMKVFSGAELPVLPDDDYIYDSYDMVRVTLGERLNYNADIFRIALEPKFENNILFYGSNKRMFKGIMSSIYRSVQQSNDMLDEVVYIGEGHIENETYIKVREFSNAAMFMSTMKDEFYTKKRIIILDNCNLVSEIGFGGYSQSKEGKAFKEFLDNINKNGSYVVAFYESLNAINEMGTAFKKYFGHKVAYDLAVSEIQNFLGADVRLSSKLKTEKRAIYCRNGKVAWFRPFVLVMTENEGD